MKAKPATIALMVASLVSGCSPLPGGLAQYASLPPADMALDAMPITKADRSDFTASQTGFSRSAVATTGHQRLAGIDPLAILQTRALIQPEMPKAARVKLAHAVPLTDPSTTATISDGQSTGSRLPTPHIKSYDREALMERLFAQGKKAVLPICEGC